MITQAVYFTAPYQVVTRQERLGRLPEDRLLVQTHLSAISPGTEMLLFRGQFPEELAVDETIASLSSVFRYPLKYGYSLVGQVVDVGEQIDKNWLGQRVFCFHPHESAFFAAPDELMVVPGDLSTEDAVFLANMETAVNFLMDGKPLIGEHVLVFGQGVVGLLTVALLHSFPLGSLVTLDSIPARRQASLDSGAQASLDPASPELRSTFDRFFPNGADLIYELSGSPQALDSAITWAGFEGRIIIGSWYGQKRAHLNLGGRFHRQRIRLISSQVSSLSSEFTGRWDKNRRLGVAWEMLRRVKPARWITHRFPVESAAQAYEQIDQHAEETIQVVLTYPT